MPPRTIAIGDVHGCSRALGALLDAVAPGPDDTVIPLGDYVDRGPDSRGVLDRLIALAGTCWLIPLLGNHDRMFLDARADDLKRINWLECGGLATLDSYGGGIDLVPPAHFAFLEACVLFHQTGSHLFVHANYYPDLPMDEQPVYMLLWESLRDHPPRPHDSGKVVVCGHTSRKGGEVLDLGFLKCIDTYCCGGRWLTALDVDSGRTWQADSRGRLRE